MPNLDYVFDDPADGEPGRDRMLVHVLWEIVLLVGIGAVGYLLWRADGNAFGGEKLDTLLLQAAVLGALATGSALALRAGAANLAIGPVAAAAALFYTQRADGGLLEQLALVIGLSALAGLAIGVLVVGLHVPGWAASLGVGLVVFMWSTQQEASTIIEGYNPRQHASYWFAGFCALAVFGGLLGLLPAVRRGVGRFRSVSDPADRRGVVAALITLGALAGSTALGGVAGLLGAAIVGASAPNDGLVATGLGVGAALLGGTSAFGRRGGIFGTVFAVGLLAVTMAWVDATGRNWSDLGFAAVAIGVGLLVSRMVERFGRPRSEEDDVEDDDWVPNSQQAPVEAWTPSQPSWQTNSQQTPTAERTWGGEGAWGTADRR